MANENVEIPERDWLTVGFFWIGAGMVSIVPPLASSWLGAFARLLFDLVVIVHVAEALYSMQLAARTGQDRRQWFLRTLILGYFAVRKLQAMTQANPA